MSRVLTGEPLLGRTCTIVASITDGGQQPLWGAAAVRQAEIN